MPAILWTLFPALFAMAVVWLATIVWVFRHDQCCAGTSNDHIAFHWHHRTAVCTPMGFPCKEFPRMRRVFDCAGPEPELAVMLCPVLPSASENSIGVPDCGISQLNGWPACAPVNASPVALPTPKHDSGSG